MDLHAQKGELFNTRIAGPCVCLSPGQPPFLHLIRGLAVHTLTVTAGSPLGLRTWWQLPEHIGTCPAACAGDAQAYRQAATQHYALLLAAPTNQPAADSFKA